MRSLEALVIARVTGAAPKIAMCYCTILYRSGRSNWGENSSLDLIDQAGVVFIFIYVSIIYNYIFHVCFI